jgi:flagellar biosynthetic protein FlhB
MPDESQERTEQATPKRLEDARQRGNVARSMELNSAFVLMAGIGSLYFFGPRMFSELTALSKTIYANVTTFTLTTDSVHRYIADGSLVMLHLLAPIVSTIMVVGLLINYAQVGVLFTVHPLIPDLDKINPIEGFKRLLSLRSFVELVKGVLKILIVGYVTYITLKGEYHEYLPLMDKSVSQIFAFAVDSAFTLFLRLALVLLILAILDYGFQRWEYQRNLRMTRYEIKEEMKQMEGPPHLRARIRTLQREIARRRMMKRVPRADVVITNPVHVAVALEYDPVEMEAPTVTAKGARLIAERIKEIATEHGVPIVENPPLAQTLYRSVDLDEEIPYNLYQAVAEILAYVYQLKNKQIA